MGDIPFECGYNTAAHQGLGGWGGAGRESE